MPVTLTTESLGRPDAGGRYEDIARVVRHRGVRGEHDRVVHRGVRCSIVAGPDFDADLKSLDATLTSVEKVLDLPRMRAEIADLGEQVAAPDLWDDQANAQKVTSRLSGLQSELDRVTG
jgi:hypothetical protein